jgi:hypothetical protein
MVLDLPWCKVTRHTRTTEVTKLKSREIWWNSTANANMHSESSVKEDSHEEISFKRTFTIKKHALRLDRHPNAQPLIRNLRLHGGGSTHLWNVGKLHREYTELHPKDCHLYTRRRENLKFHIICFRCFYVSIQATKVSIFVLVVVRPFGNLAPSYNTVLMGNCDSLHESFFFRNSL